MIGTTRSRVNSFMNKFRKLGFIEYNGDLKVHNSLLNVILHDAPHPLSETREDAGKCLLPRGQEDLDAVPTATSVRLVA